MQSVRLLCYFTLCFCCFRSILGKPQLRTVNLEIGDPCIIRDGSNGICQLDSNCQYVIDLFKNKRRDEIVNCGFKGQRQIVCCKEESKFSENFRKNILCEEKIEKIPSKPVRFDFHIVNGEEAEVSEFPHMAAIGYQGEGAETDLEFRCGGSLISSRYVVSAAHCANRRDLLPKMVRLGKTSLKDDKDGEPRQDITIQKIILHENYSSRSRLNDIALFKLEKDAVFAHNVWPICLSSQEQLDNSINATVIGFGVKENDDKSTSDWLLKGTVNAYPFEKCQKYYQTVGGKPIEGTQTCVHSPLMLVDTCQGDSGGPLEYKVGDRRYLFGITSYGAGCGGQNPSVYTRVQKYLKWIDEKMRNE